MGDPELGALGPGHGWERYAERGCREERMESNVRWTKEVGLKNWRKECHGRHGGKRGMSIYRIRCSCSWDLVRKHER